jgi:putative endonuclease
MNTSHVYIMSNRRNGPIYTGVTTDLARRVAEHKSGNGGAFTKRYGLHRLVFFEEHGEVLTAIQRETSIKRWPRAWKVRLIHAVNPEWDDLSAHW